MDHGIAVPGTTIHVFYALKMGEKYRERYHLYFKNPDIREFDLQARRALLLSTGKVGRRGC
ncbi:MAG: hypothetical protein ACLR6B_00735 [Blautia sp.]